MRPPAAAAEARGSGLRRRRALQRNNSRPKSHVNVTVVNYHNSLKLQSNSDLLRLKEEALKTNSSVLLFFSV